MCGCVIIHNMTFTCCIHNYSGTSNYGASDEGPTSLQTVCPLPIILPIHLFTFKEGTEKQDKTHFIKDLKRFHCTLYVVRVSLNFSHLHKCTKSDSYRRCAQRKKENIKYPYVALGQGTCGYNIYTVPTDLRCHLYVLCFYNIRHQANLIRHT